MNEKRRPHGLLPPSIRKIRGIFPARVTAFVSVTHYVPTVSDFTTLILIVPDFWVA
jgi:hypothetical protein